MPFYTKAQFQDILNYIIKESLKKDSQTKIELFKEIEGDSYYKWYFKNKVNTIIHKPLQEVIILPAGMFDMKEEGEDLGIKGVKID
jgi:molybdopterin-guanine dinucleotide biosynthesis protein